MKHLFLTLFLICGILILPAQELQLIVPLGHSRRVVDMDVSSDGKWLASVDGSQHIKIWNYATGEELFQFTGHTGQVNLVDYQPATNVLASAASEGTIRLWDEKGTTRFIIRPEEGIQDIAFYDSSDTLLVLTNSRLSFWNSTTGKELTALDLKQTNNTAFSWSGNQGFIGNASGNLTLVDLSEASILKTFKVTSSPIISITSVYENQLVLATEVGEIIKLNIQTGDVQTQQAFAIRNHKVLCRNARVYTMGRDTDRNFKVFNFSNLSAIDSPIKLDIDKKSEVFAFGLRSMSFPTDSTLLLADYQQVIREWDFTNKRWVNRQFRGLAAPVYDLAVNYNEKQLAIASGHDYIKIIDLTAAVGDLELAGYPQGTRSVDFHPVNPIIATYGIDEQIDIRNVISNQEVFKLKAKGDYTNTPVAFDPTGRYLLRKSSSEAFDFYDFRKKSPRTLKVENGSDFKFSPDGRKLFFKVANGISVFDPVAVKEMGFIPIPAIQDFTFHKDGSFVVLLNDDLTLQFFDTNEQKTKELVLPIEAVSDKIYWIGDALIGYRNSVTRGASPDFTLKVISKEGKLKASLPGHSGFTNAMKSVKDRYLFTSSTDGEVKLWDLQAKEAYKASIIPLEHGEYVVTTSWGLFDATPGAMKKLHYVKKGNLIALDQLKSTYYEPNLLSKILGYNEESMKTVAALSSLEMYPELNIDHPLKNDGRLGINLNDNGGGIGRIVILINGKEVSSDVRGAEPITDQSNLEIDYAIEGHPFLYTDRVNKVTIKAYNKDGTISSGEKSIYIFGEERVVEKPKLFAIVAGTSDYEGESLDLKYAAKDATDFANAVKLSANKYLGKEHVAIKLLTTDQEPSSWPTKENIKQAFTDYSKEATAKDILLVYLSGHGVNHSGTNSDFYYLTSSASNGDMNNSVIRESAAISSAEFTEYIKTVPALKQILVIDACHSGRLASSIASSRSAMSSTQIRALERMKDRTGMFVLAGSAADAVSYETTLFGQGLLTYSLLFGMKGAALRDDEFIDVLQLFQFAANKVPELAQEIGGIQKPEIRLPENGRSFDIGRLETADRDLIALKAPKPVFVYTRFQDESAIMDPLGISDLMDLKLREISKNTDAPLVFVDDKNFSGAITINGRYALSDGLIRSKVSFEQADQVIHQLELEAVNADQLTKSIMESTLQLVTDK